MTITRQAFEVGARVRILLPDSDHNGCIGTIYDYLPGYCHPYHVRPDGWDANMAGIAYTENELKLVEEAAS